PPTQYRRQALQPREQHPELLGLCAQLRPTAPYVRTERLLEPAGASLHGLGVVGQVLPRRRSDELRERATESGFSQGSGHARLRLDGSHVSPPRTPRQLAL